MCGLAVGARVQAMPKGGYYRMSLAYITEQHLRVVRAMLGYAPEADLPSVASMTAIQIRQYILDERLPRASITYRRLQAVAASLFVTMAVDVYSEGGRLHQPGRPTPLREEWYAHSLLRMPRGIVAELAEYAVTYKTTERLETAETARRLRGKPIGTVVALVTDANDVDAALLWVDGMGYKCVAESSLRNVPAMVEWLVAFETLGLQRLQPGAWDRAMLTAMPLVFVKPMRQCEREHAARRAPRPPPDRPPKSVTGARAVREEDADLALRPRPCTKETDEAWWKVHKPAPSDEGSPALFV